MAQQNTYYPTLPDGYTFGDYRIEYPMGQDSMGVTYLAWDAGRNAWVFIKENMPQSCALREADGVQVRPRTGADDQYLRLLSDFYAEAQTMSELKHPGVAPILRFFRACGTAYYAIPCDGEHTLGQWFEKKGKLGRKGLVSLLRSLVSTLGYLHGQGLGPWDIRPESFMMKADDTPVLVEFSVLRRLIGGNVDLIQTSPGFAGIELEDGENVGPWTDFYALGVTLYALLTDEPLQNCKSRRKGDMLIPLRNRPFLVEEYGKELLEGIDKAMAVEPGDRWQSAEAWLAALDSIPVEEAAPAPAPATAPVEVKEEPKPVEPVVEIKAPVVEEKKPVASEPAPEKKAEPVQPVPAPVALLDEPAPLESELLPEPTPKKRLSVGNLLAIGSGIVLAGIGCSALLMTDEPDKLMTTVESALPGHAGTSVAEPAKPAEPAETVKPAEPVAPAQPAKPAEPVAVVENPPAPVQPRPTVPEKPTVEPQSPVEPVKPTPAVVDVPKPADKPAVVQETPKPADKPAVAQDAPKPETPAEPAKPAVQPAAPASLAEAVRTGDKDALTPFLEKGATPQEIQEAFGIAASEGYVEIVSLLLDKGARMDVAYERKYNALGLAVDKGRTEVAKLLLEKGSPRNTRYEGDYTALMFAARDGNVEIVKALVDKSANVWIKNVDHDTALIIAIREGHAGCAKLIMAGNADVNAKNKKGMRPIDYAKSPDTKLSDKERANLIRLLKSNGAKD